MSLFDIGLHQALILAVVNTTALLLGEALRRTETARRWRRQLWSWLGADLDGVSEA